jgi:hypothetical protein
MPQTYSQDSVVTLMPRTWHAQIAILPTGTSRLQRKRLVHNFTQVASAETRCHAADRARAGIAVLPAGTPAFPRRRFVHDFTSRFRGNALLCRVAWTQSSVCAGDWTRHLAAR